MIVTPASTADRNALAASGVASVAESLSSSETTSDALTRISAEMTTLPEVTVTRTELMGTLAFEANVSAICWMRCGV